VETCAKNGTKCSTIRMASRTRDIGVMSHHTRIAGFEIRIRNLVDLKNTGYGFVLLTPISNIACRPIYLIFQLEARRIRIRPTIAYAVDVITGRLVSSEGYCVEKRSVRRGQLSSFVFDGIGGKHYHGQRLPAR